MSSANCVVGAARSTPLAHCIDCRRPSHFGLSRTGCIILGFTRDGHHLVSYTTSGVAAAAGAHGFSLQLWAFGPSGRLRRAWSAPLFRTGPYLSSLTEEHDEFTPELEMSITVAEAPDGSLIGELARENAAPALLALHRLAPAAAAAAMHSRLPRSRARAIGHPPGAVLS